MADVLAHMERDKISLAQLAYANELSISGRDKAEIDAFLDKILGAMRATVKTGLAAPEYTLPGPIKLKTKAGEVFRNSQTLQQPARRAIGMRLCGGPRWFGRECPRAPCHYGADRRFCGRDAGGHLVPRD